MNESMVDINAAIALCDINNFIHECIITTINDIWLDNSHNLYNNSINIAWDALL